jgi:hypothetical protein
MTKIVGVSCMGGTRSRCEYRPTIPQPKVGRETRHAIAPRRRTGPTYIKKRFFTPFVSRRENFTGRA